MHKCLAPSIPKHPIDPSIPIFIYIYKYIYIIYLFIYSFIYVPALRCGPAGAGTCLFFLRLTAGMCEGRASQFEFKCSVPAAVESMLQFIYTGDLVLPSGTEAGQIPIYGAAPMPWPAA